MDITPERLRTMHTHLLGTEPTEGQEKLYAAFPKFRGFDDGTLNEERFAAAVILTFAQARESDRVLLLAPLSHEKWVLGQYNAVADRVFTNCKTLPGTSEKRIQLAKLYGTTFKRIFLFGRLLQLVEPPRAWASFGFTSDGPIPDWLKERLLAV